MQEPETLEGLRRQLAPAIADAAVFDGWTMDAVRQAARLAGIDAALAEFAFREGPMAMISAWVRPPNLAWETPYCGGSG